MDFIVRSLPFVRDPANGPIGDIGRETAGDEGLYQTSPALGKPPPPALRSHQDSANGGLECASVKIVIEPGDPFGQMRVDTTTAKFVGEPVRPPSSVHRPKLHETSSVGLIIEEIELIQAFHRAINVIRFESLVAELIDQLGAEMITPSDELERLVVCRIFHINSR